MVFHYEPEQGLVVTAFQMKNTVFTHVFGRPEYWFLAMSHILFKALYCMGFMDSADIEGSDLYLDWSTINVMTLFTMYLSVFYSNSSYENYLNLYAATRFSLGCLCDFAFLVKMTFQKTNLAHMRMAYRFFASSIYLGLQHAKHACEHSVPDEKMRYLLRNRYLSTTEYRYLSKLPVEDRYMRLQAWSTEVIVMAFIERLQATRLKPLFKVDLKVHPELRPLPLESGTLFCRAMLASRCKRHQMLEMLALPIPFQYFHIVTCMVLTNCALWSYKMATNTSLAASLVFLIAQGLYLGMLELAVQLSNPFGDDDVDFSLDEWIENSFSHCLSFLDAVSPGDEDDWEHALEAQGKLCYLPAEPAKEDFGGQSSFDPFGRSPRTTSARQMRLGVFDQPAVVARTHSELFGGMNTQHSSNSTNNQAIGTARSSSIADRHEHEGIFDDASDDSMDSDCS